MGLSDQLVRREVQASLDGIELDAVLYDQDDPTVSYLSAHDASGPATLRVSSDPSSSWPTVERLDESGRVSEIDHQVASSVQRFARHDMTRLAPPPQPQQLDLTSLPMLAWPIERPQLDNAAPAAFDQVPSEHPDIADLGF